MCRGPEKRALMKMFHEFYRAEKEKRKKAKGKCCRRSRTDNPASFIKLSIKTKLTISYETLSFENSANEICS
ncbi:hypothetical protein BHT95_07730 [Bacillus paralicheniformis]|nr:hypothetical protein ACH97_219290 [Bacillus paralicheniformis]OLQ52746.1 hypothetical protein BHT95_07730 [Bacillus paralicheniformis]